MRKSFQIFVKGLFCLTLVLTSCSGKELPKEQNQSQETVKDTAETFGNDTVWLSEEVTKYNSWNWELDTIFEKDNETISLSMSLRRLKEGFDHIVTRNSNDTVFAQKLVGPQFELSIVANTKQDGDLISKTLTKGDLITDENAHYLVADSYTEFKFLGYHPKFNAILLKTLIGYPNTDRGTVEYIFLGLDGKIKKQITNGHFFDLCDCEIKPSPDGKTFSFCKGILHSNYSMTPVKRGTPLAGIFQLGNNHSLAIYMFEGKPPYANMKVLSNSGTVVKSFPFEGISGEMSYSIPHCWIDSGQRLVLLDNIQRQVMIFDINDPLKPTQVPFDTIKEENERVKSNGEKFNFWTMTTDFTLYYFEGEFLLIE